MMKNLSVLFVSLILFVSINFAQEQYGNIRGVVQDEQGSAIPGVVVSLESELYGSRPAITSAGGIFRFLNVSVGLCQIKCETPGFKTYVQENIDIRVGLNVDLRITMFASAMEEEITVVAEYPIVDPQKTGTSTNFTQQMLQEVPSARDPWEIVKQAPGVAMSYENVGGSSSGYQLFFSANGNMGWDNMWSMDGIPITNMAGYNSPMFYDFGMFEEIQIVTSGTAASLQTGGVSINLITRRGSNTLSVAGRAYYTSDELQSDNRTQELEDLGYYGDNIHQITDYGLQMGGAIKRDRLWFWLGTGVQDIRRLAITGDPDETKLVSINSKLNFQIHPKNRAELFFMYNNKSWDGLYVGITRPPETTFGQDWDTYYVKVEDEHIFSDNLLLSLKLSYLSGQEEQIPKGGLNVQTGYDIATGIYSDTYNYRKSKYPSYLAKVNGNYFLEEFLGGDHEFKFGYEYRLTPALENSRWAGDGFKYYMVGMPWYAEVTREGVWDYGGDRNSLWVIDTYSKGRFTFNFGLRFDSERNWSNDASVEASKVGPDLLPAMTFSGKDPNREALRISPRIGITYDLEGNGKTILRGNLARYHSQGGILGAFATSASSDAGAGYFWEDFNYDDHVTTDELWGYPTDGILWFWGFDPWDPKSPESTQISDEDMRAELTDELILGIEREMFRDFALGANLILRNNRRLIMDAYYGKETNTKTTRQDYVGPITGSIMVDGKTYDYEYWTLSEYRPPYLIWENRSGYHENYTGFEIVAAKRFSHKWMMNASFTYQKHTVHWGDNGWEYYDPTNWKMVEGSRSQWLGADWMFKLSFLYQLPWEIYFSCFANGRQGYVRPQWIRIVTPERAEVGLGATMDLYVEPPGDTRLPNFYKFDVSFRKDFRLSGYGRVSLIVDVFNVFNADHALSRYNIINSPRYDEIERILNPRVIRFGVRYQY